MLAEHPSWWRSLKAAEQRWTVPPGFVLAVVRQESGFIHDARPPREGGFLFIPGKRPSSAYGYAQALDETWAQYQRAASRSGAERDEFGDAADFVGWYHRESQRRLRLPPTAYREHYLAYHDGHGGFARGTWRNKKWLIDVAGRVAQNARSYDAQINACRARLDRRGLPRF